MSSTTTTTVIERQQTSLTMISGPLISDFDGNSRMVRFDDECILIPQPSSSKRSKSLRTYSLPLWKKKLADSELEATAPPSRGSLSPEETHVVFKVPIPRFISRSPTRGRNGPASPTLKPLSPCLVKREPSSSPTSTHPKAIRRTSLPIATSSKQKDDAALTVPLRPCCSDCVHITEESLKEGEQWQEKFSRGARRRRSASLDNSDNFSPVGSWSTTSGHSAAFAALAANPLQADLGPISNPRYRNTKFSITVDEVDKRRKSQEYTEEELNRFRARSPSPRVPHSPNPQSHPSVDKDTRATSTSSPNPELSPLEIPPRRLKSSPIQEEDEDQLFPLPSPRRTPNASPSPSVNASPVASPSTSSACLVSVVAAASKDNLLHVSNASSEMLAVPLGRKATNGYTKSSSQPSPKTTTVNDEQPTLSLQSFTVTDTSVKTVPKAQSPILTEPLTRFNPTPTKPLSIPAPTRREATYPIDISPPSISASPRTSSKPIAIPYSSPRSPSASSSPTKTRRPSFSLPAIRDAIKGAGVDVLKGVSSMGGGGGMVGSV